MKLGKSAAAVVGSGSGRGFCSGGVGYLTVIVGVFGGVFGWVHQGESLRDTRVDRVERAKRAILIFFYLFFFILYIILLFIV